MRELYVRYVRQQERYRGYRNLFVFLGFMALLMAMLYTQRQANVSFQVHKSINDVIVPKQKVMGNINQLYSWLRGVFRVSRGVSKSCLHVQAPQRPCMYMGLTYPPRARPNAGSVG